MTAVAEASLAGSGVEPAVSTGCASVHVDRFPRASVVVGSPRAWLPAA